jgi:PAS domain S-box-containing protein
MNEKSTRIKSEPEHPNALNGAILQAPIGIAMAITDLQGRFLECNPAWSAMLGYPLADLQALDLTALTHPGDQAHCNPLIERLCPREVPHGIVENRYLTQAGQTIWCRTHLALLGADDHLPGRLLLMAEDRTANHLAEQQIQKSQRLHRMAGRMAQLGGWTFDGIEQRLFCSDETCNIHGGPPGYPSTIEEGISCYAPEYREMVEQAAERCLEHGEPFAFEAELVRADGQRVWVRAIGESVCDETGAITGFEGAFQDISVQRRQETERHALAAKLKATMERISEAFFTLDHNWIITFANQEMSRVAERRCEEMIGMLFWDVFPEAENSSFHACYQSAFDTGTRTTLIDYYAPRGMWFEAHAHPTEDGLAVHFQDITQRRKDEAQLRLLQTCVERMNDVVVITEADPLSDTGPKVIYANEAFEKTTGYRCDEIIGKTPRILQGPKTQREALDRIRARLEAWQPVREELLNYTKQGEEIWQEIDISPVADETGCYTHWIGIERNVTERKRAAQAISNQAALLDKAQDAIWVIDLDARITYWNRSAERIHGWAMSDAMGADARNLLYQDQAVFDQCRQAVLETGEWVGEVEHKTHEGKTLRLISRLTLVRDEAEQPTAILTINTDVTQQKALEQQLLHAQRMDSIGTLAGGIAHNLNNMLAPILMSISMLKEDIQDAESQALLRTIEVSAQRSADLIRQVLSFAHGVEGRRHEIRLDAVRKELDHLLSDTIPRNIAVHWTVPADLQSIEGDATQLQQVLLNLCINARDAMPKGGRIGILAENVMLDAHYAAMNIEAREGPYVRIEVEDSGSGIDPANLEKIFEPFFTTKRVGQGTGLGLSTTQTIVKSHGGFIRVHSELNTGTRFCIYLPASARACTASASASELPVAAPRGQGELIMLVDDEEAIRQVTRQTLEAYGYEVLVAANGAEAVALFEKHIDQVDLVLTDMSMPVMDGRATIQALRQLRPNVRIVGASGTPQHGKPENMVDGYLRHFLSKPYTADVLLRALAKALADKDTPGE